MSEEREESGRRVKRLFLDSNMVRALLHGQCRINELDVPSNVKIVSVSSEWPIVGVFLLIEHESFEPVPDGEMPPQMHAEWRRTEVDVPIVLNAKPDMKPAGCPLCKSPIFGNLEDGWKCTQCTWTMDALLIIPD